MVNHMNVVFVALSVDGMAEHVVSELNGFCNFH